MGLQTYRRKRKFESTPEPRGKVRRARGDLFVIQKHAASRLHYDFRLELDGVLKSWAVTRGPSLIPGEKRLAVHVEDHPLDYGEFEGTIPKGQYGGGTVMLWDRGHWTPEGDPHKGYKKGHLTFTLDGKKLKGAWHLIRMRKRAGERQEPWLLIKSEDEAARGPRDLDVLEELPLSVKTGRDLDAIAEGKGGKRIWHSDRDEGTRAKAATIAEAPRAKIKGTPQAKRAPRRKKSSKAAKKKSTKVAGAALPDFVPPSLASLRERAPSGERWIHEIKFDGYRIQARLDHGEVKLLTRKALDWAERFPNVAEAVGILSATTAMIDGEIVVQNDKGISDFSALQAALTEGDAERFIYYAFDLLHLDGEDLTREPLIERKRKLEDLFKRSKGVSDGPIRLSEHFEGEGPVVLDQACKLNLEGVLSKMRDAPYTSGRTDLWIKAKCTNRQEFVVIGYSPSTASRGAIGALVLAYRDGDKLRYGGRMGTGYTHAAARDLMKRLRTLEIARAPVDVPRDERRRDVHWVKPQLVVEADLRGWTASGVVRQAAFKGIREDKSPDEVDRENPAMVQPQAQSARHARKAIHLATRSAKLSSGKPVEAGAVQLTNPDRVYWPDVGVTKQQLAEFYTTIWDWMAPHLVDRPISLLRCPEGTAGECFFQKHAHAGLEDKFLKIVVDAKKRQVLAVRDLNGLLALVQAGVLEIHVRGSMIDRLDVCDRIVFDLDPGEGVTWKQIVGAARDVRRRLADLDLESFVKVSGGKGLHVVLPIDGADWATTKAFVQAVATSMAASNPDRYVARMTKSLRDGKIFVDYLRNSLEQTSVGAYSTRARAGAPVSIPVSWEELGRIGSANQFTLLNLSERLGRLKVDPWANIGKVRQKLPNLRALR